MIAGIDRFLGLTGCDEDEVAVRKVKKGETKPPMPVNEALTRMLGSAKKFDVAAVRQQDLALVAAVASE